MPLDKRREILYTIQTLSVCVVGEAFLFLAMLKAEAPAGTVSLSAPRDGRSVARAHQLLVRGENREIQGHVFSGAARGALEGLRWLPAARGGARVYGKG